MEFKWAEAVDPAAFVPNIPSEYTPLAERVTDPQVLKAQMFELRVAAARPKTLPMADGQTIGKLALAAATHHSTKTLFRCHI